MRVRVLDAEHYAELAPYIIPRQETLYSIYDGTLGSMLHDSLVSIHVSSMDVLRRKTAYLFADYSALKEVYIEDFSVEDCESMFSSDTALHTVEILSMGATCWTIDMFRACRSLKYVTLPDILPNVERLHGMFYTCESLESIRIPDIPKADNIAGMFSNCKSLKEVVFPDTLPNVVRTDSLFYNCTSLEEVKLPHMPKVWGVETMFKGCSSLRKVIIPKELAYPVGKLGCVDNEIEIIEY